MKIKLLIFSLLFSVVGWSQIGIPNTTPVTQNFDAIGASATAALPTGVRVNTTANYTTGTTATTVVYGTTGVGVVTSASSGGCVNWANGITASSTDRAVGFLSSGSFSSPRSIIVAIQNTGSTNITDLLVSFDYEKYRSGTRAYDWTFFHGATATNVNTAAVAGNQSYGVDANNTTVSNPPTAVSKSFTLSGLNIAPSGLYYLCWTYTGLAGATNAQGLGLDNLSLTATFACASPSTQASAIATNTITANGCNVNWAAGNGTGTMIVVRPTASANTLPSSGTPYTANLAWASAGQIDTNNRVIFGAAGTTAGPITGLTPATQYTVTAYEYNTATNCYNTTTPVSTTFYTVSTEPTGHASSFSCSAVSGSQIDLSFSDFSTVPGAIGYIIMQSTTGVPTGVPTDGSVYAPGAVIGDATVVAYVNIAATTTFNVTGLSPSTTYYYTLIPYNAVPSTSATVNYYTSPTIPNTNCTTTGAVVAITSGLTSSSVYGSGYSYTITATGSPTSYNAIGLPAGLSIDTNTGIISGTPTVGVGTYNIDISAIGGTTDTKTLVLTITAKNLTITGLTADNKVYDRILTATLSGTATLVGVVGSDVVTVSGTPAPTFATVVVGTVKPVTVTGYTLSGAQAGNYTVTQPSGFTADITVKPLTVSGAVANNKVYNGTTVATITGATLVGVVAPDVVTITPSGTFATANAGTAIAVTSTSTISGADSSNYSLTQPTGLAADITPASQTITFNALANQYIGAANFNLTATASSGLTVTYVSSNPAVATVSGNTVTVVGIGTTVITASQAGNGNYAAAVDVNQNQVITVTPCLSSNFDSSTSVPAGWSGSSVNDAVASHLQSAPNCRALGATKDLITSAMDNPIAINFYVDASGAGGQVGTLWYRIGAGSWISVGTFTATTAGATVNFDLSAITAEMNVSFKISSATNTIYIDDLKAFCATTWNGSSWSNGVPTLGMVAVINGNYNTTTNGNIDASSLFVNAGFTATITDGMYFNVQNNVTVAAGGTLDVQNNGSLVQINDAGVNTGNIVMHRTTNVKLQDYVYWSSAVTGFAVANVSPSTPSNGIWKWNPTVVNPNGGEGYWQSGSGNMNVGEGYIVRAPNGYSNVSATPYTANFTGVPNNGIVTPAISRGSDLGAGSNGTNGILRTATDDNWNLLGNPYPSAIGIDAFLTANTEIDGFVRLWTHGTLPNTGVSNPYYGNYWTSNYTTADYIAVNGAGATSGPGLLSVIGAGQGFFVLMNPGAATTSSVTFTNAMRNKTFSNSQFFRSSNLQNNSQQAGTALENHRIWMDLVSSTGKTTRTLVSYVEGATAGKDRLFDAATDYEDTQNFYSILSNNPMTIQGRSLPFDTDDTVEMGIKVPTNGTYTIAIAAVDGLFNSTSQKIYIEDKLLNTIHDLTTVPYEFTTNQGIVNDRFVLRYTNQTLSTQDFSNIENGVTVYPSNNEIRIGSRVENIKDYTVYNVLGQVLATKNKVNANESVVTSILKNNQALIVKVTLENGLVVTRKIMF